MAGPRWWRWLAVLALFAGVHDVVMHLGRPYVAAAAEETPPSETPAESPDGTAKPAAHSQPHDAEGHEGGHHDPAAPVLLAIVVIILAAKIAGDLFDRLQMPAVLGELLVGVLLGNVAFFVGIEDPGGIEHPETVVESIVVFIKSIKPPEPEDSTNPYHAGAVLQILASIGVVLLLFEVGLESSVKGMMSVGVSAGLVAILGVVAPIALGYGVSLWLLPSGMEGGLRQAAAAFIGATLCATSVGITARVLKDMGRSQQTESQIILGAAVVDDVLGLIVLAVVSGVITAASGGAGATEGNLPWEITKIVLLAFGFLAGALILGAVGFQRALFKYASALRGHGLLVATSLVICFGFSYMANAVGLATIVGAFAAGLILEGAHYKELGERENHHLEEALAPLSGLLVPIFFVDMGLQVDLKSFTNPSVWALAGAITVAAIVGKQVCSLGVREKGLNKIAVGLGMIPRGEVGLIFANEGKNLYFGGERVIGNDTYSAVIVMVMITTMVTPPLLKWSLQKGDGGSDGGDESPGESAAH